MILCNGWWVLKAGWGKLTYSIGLRPRIKHIVADLFTCFLLSPILRGSAAVWR